MARFKACLVGDLRTPHHLVAERYRQTSHYDKRKRLDFLVWKETEQLLKKGKADVLVIFDW